MSNDQPPHKSDRIPLYRFTAIQEDKSPAQGTIRAHSREAAREQLHLRFAHLLTLEEVVESDWRQHLSTFFRSNDSLPVYTKGMAVMLDAGLPLAQIFDVSANGEDGFLNDVMLDIGNSIRIGRSLSASLSRWQMVFDHSFIGMCRAAERSGRLHVTFKRLADLLERRWALRKRLKAALTYPVLISLVALAIFWILVVVVVPGLAPSFREIGATLPLPTRILISISELSTSLPIIFTAGLLVFLGGLLFYRMVLRGSRFPVLQLYWDVMLLRLPLFGKLYRLAILTRSLGTMSALIESGLPMTDVLGITGEVGGSPVYRRHYTNVLIHIKDGTPMAESLTLAGGFPPLVTGVVLLGEESGKLPFLLSKIADLYEEDFETSLQTLTTFVEPVLLGIMGIVIGFIVLGTFMPMINLIQQI
ncbi:MAG: type II secretion system F family protein [Vulcanimicrobiota bacterium]